MSDIVTGFSLGNADLQNVNGAAAGKPGLTGEGVSLLSPRDREKIDQTAGFKALTAHVEDDKALPEAVKGKVNWNNFGTTMGRILGSVLSGFRLVAALAATVMRAGAAIPGLSGVTARVDDLVGKMGSLKGFGAHTAGFVLGAIGVAGGAATVAVSSPLPQQRESIAKFGDLGPRLASNDFYTPEKYNELKAALESQGIKPDFKPQELTPALGSLTSAFSIREGQPHFNRDTFDDCQFNLKVLVKTLIEQCGIDVDYSAPVDEKSVTAVRLGLMDYLKNTDEKLLPAFVASVRAMTAPELREEIATAFTAMIERMPDEQSKTMLVILRQAVCPAPESNPQVSGPDLPGHDLMMENDLLIQNRVMGDSLTRVAPDAAPVIREEPGANPLPEPSRGGRFQFNYGDAREEARLKQELSGRGVAVDLDLPQVTSDLKVITALIDPSVEEGLFDKETLPMFVDDFAAFARNILNRAGISSYEANETNVQLVRLGIMAGLKDDPQMQATFSKYELQKELFHELVYARESPTFVQNPDPQTLQLMEIFRLAVAGGSLNDE